MRKYLLALALLFLPLTAGASLTSYYQQRGQSLPSVAARAPVAQMCGIVQNPWEYQGLYTQNVQLEACLRANNSLASGGMIGATISRPELFYTSSLTRGLSLGGSETEIYVSTLPTETTGYLIVNPLSATTRELIKYTGTSASGGNHLTGVTRGLAEAGTTGSAISDARVAANAKRHSSGETISMNNGRYEQNIIDQLNGLVTSSIAATDANPFRFLYLPQGPSTTATNPLEFVTLGQLTSVSSTGCANASATVRGCVEEATNSEVEAGTTAGGTGSRLYVNPSSWLEYSDTHWSNNLAVGENVTAFNVLYISSTGKYMIAHGNVQSEIDKIAGVTFETVTATNFPRVYKSGSVIYGTSGMATGSLVYLSDSGTASTTAGSIRKVIGVALGTNVWDFNPMVEQTQINPASSSQFTIPLTDASSTLRGWSGAFGGDGTDGALNVTSGTTTINLNSTNIVVKQYTSINISAGAVLTFSNPPNDGSFIVLKSRGNCTIAGTINGQGFGAATSTRAFGLLEATQAYNAAVTNTYLYANATYKVWAGMQALAMGSGGQSVATASTSGRGGPNIRMECAGAVSFTGTINVNGEAGLAGINGSTAGPGKGGGAGGGGGSFEGFANRVSANSGTVTFAGGVGGRGGDGACTTNSNTDGNGASGATGGGAFLGAGGAGGGGETGGGSSVYVSCTPGTGGAGGATNGAAGAAGAGGSHGGGAGTLYHGGAGGGGGAGHGGFSLGWVQNYWFN